MLPLDTTTFPVALPGDTKRKLICRYLSARKAGEFEDMLAEAAKSEFLGRERTAFYVQALGLTAEALYVEGQKLAVADLDAHYTRAEIDSLVDEAIKQLILTEVDKKKSHWQSQSKAAGGANAIAPANV